MRDPQSALRASLLALALGATAFPVGPARAEDTTPKANTACRVLEATGDRFCKEGGRWVLANARPPEFAVGDVFPIYEQSMLMALDRYGLPPVDGPWRYYLRDKVIYKVSARDQTVIEVVGPARSR